MALLGRISMTQKLLFGRYNLEQVLSRLQIGNRGWTVLHNRSGLTVRQTLEQVGRSFEVTRERVRQIEKQARNRLRNGTLVLAEVGTVLEENNEDLGAPFSTTNTRTSILRRIEKVLVSGGFEPSEVAVRYRLVVALRAGEIHFRKEWPNTCFLVCSLSPAIEGNPRVHSALEREREARRESERRWSYAELAVLVLEEEGAPMHWGDIVDRAERLGKRASISPTSFFNALGYKKHRFVRVGSGTYGLSTWGMTERLSNVDLTSIYLQERKRPASFGEIYQHVGAPVNMKINSVKMSLDLNPRFYESIDGEYGLRAWLPPREKQTLRTPRWQIETPESFARVMRAEARGYDIASILARDRDLII